VNYYGPIFLLYELSTPFLNIHWFCDKLKLTGSNYQLVNGVCLITTFFCSRIVWGMYNSTLVFHDIYTAWQQDSIISSEDSPTGIKHGLGQNVTAPQPGSAYATGEIMRFSTGARSVPLWLAGAYLASNATLTLLNVHWFSRMIDTLRKRFEPAEKQKAKKEEAEPVVQRGVYENGRKTVEVEVKEVRSRRRG